MLLNSPIPVEEGWPTSEEQRLLKAEHHRGCQSLRVVGKEEEPFGAWTLSDSKSFHNWFYYASDLKFPFTADTGERLSRLENRERERDARDKVRDAEIAELKQAVSQLLGDHAPVKLGAFEAWRESEDADKYSGKHVAFLESKGCVIAAHESLGELLSNLKELDPKGEAVVGLVA